MNWLQALLSALPFRLKVSFLVLIKIEAGKKKAPPSST
jgi:hypothetical protein